MSIYSLKQGYYLYHDVEFVLNQIGKLYEVDVKDSKATAVSVIVLDKKTILLRKKVRIGLMPLFRK